MPRPAQNAKGKWVFQKCACSIGSGRQCHGQPGQAPDPDWSRPRRAASASYSRKDVGARSRFELIFAQAAQAPLPPYPSRGSNSILILILGLRKI